MDLSELPAPVAAAIQTPDELSSAELTRWELAWSHRPLLLAMARSRVGWHEAEDVVSEALLRSQRAEDVSDAALRSWLVTTTMRLCADVHRSSARDVRRGQRMSGRLSIAEPGPEDDVVDRHEAQWLAGQVHKLPGRQAEAIGLKSDGYEVGSIAGRMGLPYKAVESLLSRARRSLKGWAAVAIGVWSLSRFIGRRTAQLHIVAAVAFASASVASPLVGAATTVSEGGVHVHRVAPATPTIDTKKPGQPALVPAEFPVGPTAASGHPTSIGL
jgi:RNA polymerase sigma factor (sigma-70 family)